MGLNELILILTAIFSASLVFISWKLDKGRLYSVMLIFLILISVGGAKVVEFFGFETNTGNIFYAAVFLATYFLIERYSRREGVRSIWVGVIGLVFFSILLEFVVALVSTPISADVSAALSAAFAPASRLALASLGGYVLAQSLNVYLYISLKQRFKESRLWLRANIANALAQVLDSVVFFVVAFWGVVPSENIAEIIITGIVIKVVFMMLAAPLLYLNAVEQEDGEGYSVVTFR